MGDDHQPIGRGSSCDWNSNSRRRAKPENGRQHISLEQYHHAGSDHPRIQRKQAASVDEDRREQARPAGARRSDDPTITIGNSERNVPQRQDSKRPAQRLSASPADLQELDRDSQRLHQTKTFEQSGSENRQHYPTSQKAFKPLASAPPLPPLVRPVHLQPNRTSETPQPRMEDKTRRQRLSPPIPPAGDSA